MTFPDFLRNPGASHEFTVWLRKFLDGYIPASLLQTVKTGLFFNRTNTGGSITIETLGINDDGVGVEFVSGGGDIEMDAPAHGVTFTGGNARIHVTGGSSTGIVLTADDGPVNMTASGTHGLIALTSTQISLTSVSINIAPTAGNKIGFFGATPIVKPTGVAVTAAGIHAALVSLGLIAP